MFKTLGIGGFICPRLALFVPIRVLVITQVLIENPKYHQICNRNHLIVLSL